MVISKSTEMEKKSFIYCCTREAVLTNKAVMGGGTEPSGPSNKIKALPRHACEKPTPRRDNFNSFMSQLFVSF